GEGARPPGKRTPGGEKNQIAVLGLESPSYEKNRQQASRVHRRDDTHSLPRPAALSPADYRLRLA
ncbi:MAG: hypothetical protein ACK46M_23890, partial [Planctomyces sp.]